MSITALACDCAMALQAAVKEFASETAERMYVGKRGGQKSIAQPEIDDLLVKHCRQVCLPCTKPAWRFLRPCVKGLLLLAVALCSSVFQQHGRMCPTK